MNSSEPSETMLEKFEAARSRMWSIAYRMLGSVADAEDALQDTFLKWQGAVHKAIENAQAWLVTTCTRRCIDILRAAKASRIDYVGPWLPEPILDEEQSNPAETLELASSLATAFLVLLERLTPVERAAYLLRDIFDYSYKDSAAILDKNDAACRQIVSRSKKQMDQKRRHILTPDAHQQELLDRFLDALRSGDPSQLEQMLTSDAELWGDGGGKVTAALNIIKTTPKVSQFLAGVWEKSWHKVEFSEIRLNGSLGFLVIDKGEIVGTISFAQNDPNQISQIFIVRNPEKLTHISTPK